MSVNKAIIKGRLGTDPENRSGVVNLSIATDDGYKDKDGNKVEVTNWHRATAFGKLAEVIEKWFKKGDEIFIVGRIQYREHEGKYYTNIIINEFDFVGSRQESRPTESPSRPESSAPPKSDDGLPF